MGRAFFTVIAAIAQLERELIVERVKNGLKNAKAKGIHIGRKKTRPSELIRAMLRKNVPYRKIAEIANCSHGAIYSERVAMRREEELLKQQTPRQEGEKGIFEQNQPAQTQADVT